MECCGISGDLLALIRSFLSNRKQRVVLNGKSSQWAAASAGVPQGSVLGPLFFLTYIIDIVDNIDCNFRLSADGTSLFCTVKSENVTAEKLNRNLDRLRLWVWQLKMQFNAD